MVEGLRNWIINIATAVVFITAVEMILPNNKLKKYTRFVLGLILITVMLNPIIRLLDGSFNLDNYSTRAMNYLDEKSYENNYDKYKQQNLKNTISTFEANLSAECEKTLKDKFPGSSYKVETEALYDEKNQSVTIKNIKIGVKNGSVDKVKKVEVTTKGDNGVDSEILKDDKSRKIKDFLSSELKISNEAIVVYKL